MSPNVLSGEDEIDTADAERESGRSQEADRRDNELVNEVGGKTTRIVFDNRDCHKLAANAADTNFFRVLKCGFNYSGTVGEPTPVPDTKAKFLTAVSGEIKATEQIQKGLNAYVRAITSGEHHKFSDEFLIQQNTAAQTAIGQLWQIAEHLRDLSNQVQASGSPADGEIRNELREAFRLVQPWILRTRAILVSHHVFYKINYVASSGSAIE